MFGFIILRHVNNKETNKYWIECVKSIRDKYLENEILIIDDNSDEQYVSNEEFHKTTIIQSEYKGRAELLPYIYYLKTKLFDTAVIIHDSVFFNKYIDFDNFGHEYQFIWEFEHTWDQPNDELDILSVFNDNLLIQIYHNKHLWKGCFGAMTVIKYEYLSSINSKYDFSKLIPIINTKNKRCAFERVIACLFRSNGPNSSLLGNLHTYCPWNLTYNDKSNYNHLPLYKCWTQGNR